MAAASGTPAAEGGQTSAGDVTMPLRAVATEPGAWSADLAVIELYTVQYKALVRLAAMLVRSFDDDPIAKFMFAGRRRRQRGLHSFFTSQMRHQFLPYGQIYTAGDLQGAAIWGPPGRPRAGLRELAQLIPTAPFLVSFRMGRALRLLFEIDGLHPTEPHWYLEGLGTHPDWQRLGLASAVLAPILDRCDAEGLPAYLETQKEINLPFYRRHGFEVTGTLALSNGAPMLWLMWRDPARP